MRGEIYRALFIYISTFYTSEHLFFIESRWTRQEVAKTTGLAKPYLLVDEAGKHIGTTITTAAIAGNIVAGSAIGIGMTTLPNELSSPEINSMDQLDMPSIPERTNVAAVFGMQNQTDRDHGETAGAAAIFKRTFANPKHDMKDQLDADDGEETDSGYSTSRSSINSYFSFNHRNDDVDPNGSFMDSNQFADAPNPMVAENLDHYGDVHFSGQREPLLPIGQGIHDLIPERTNNNGNDMPGQGIDIPIRSVGNGEHTQIQTGREHNTLGMKTGNLMICMVSGIVAFGILAAFVSVTIAINKSNSVDEMTKEIDTMKKMMDKMGKKSVETRKVIDEMTEEHRIDLDRIARLKSLLPDICKPYKNTTFICDSSDIYTGNICMDNMIYCLDKHNISTVSLPKRCSALKNGISIRDYLFDEYKVNLNEGMECRNNISSLNCTSITNRFNDTISKMARIYKCKSEHDFQNDLMEELLKSCNGLQKGEIEISNMCRIHQNIDHLQKKESFWEREVIGAIGKNLQTLFDNCTETYNQDYYNAHLSSTKVREKLGVESGLK